MTGSAEDEFEFQRFWELEFKDCVQEVNIPQISQDNHSPPKRTAACKAADLMKKWAQEFRAPPKDVVNH